MATSASTGALGEGVNGLDEGGVVDDASQQGGEGRKGKKSRTPREPRTRKKIGIDSARATDTVVKAAAAGGGLVSPARPDSGRSS